MKKAAYEDRCLRVYDKDVPDPQLCSFPKGHNRTKQPCGTDWDWCDQHNQGVCLVADSESGEAVVYEETPASTRLEQDFAKFIRDNPATFAGISATRAASQLVEFLAGCGLLIKDNRIHAVQETNLRGTECESVAWDVYTEPEDND